MSDYRVPVYMKDGPLAGKRFTFRGDRPLPSVLHLPIWPEPDDYGPPYDRAVYVRQVNSTDYRYSYTEKAEHPLREESDTAY